MNKEELQTILKYEDTNAPLPIKIKVKYPDETYEECDIKSFHQFNDCFLLIPDQKAIYEGNEIPPSSLLEYNDTIKNICQSFCQNGCMEHKRGRCIIDGSQCEQYRKFWSEVSKEINQLMNR